MYYEYCWGRHQCCSFWCVYLDECEKNVSWLLFNCAKGVSFLISSLLDTLSQWLIMCEWSLYRLWMFWHCYCRLFYSYWEQAAPQWDTNECEQIFMFAASVREEPNLNLTGLLHFFCSIMTSYNMCECRFSEERLLSVDKLIYIVVWKRQVLYCSYWLII